MTKRMITMFSVLAVLGGGAAVAQEDDAMRCQARTLRCESEYFQCLSRCDRRLARVAAQARPAPAAVNTKCDARCERRHANTMERIASTPPCVAVDATPDPAACEARLLRIDANRLVCESRCGRPHGERFDPEACLAGCETRCGTAYDRVMAQGKCSAGRIGESPVCGTE